MLKVYVNYPNRRITIHRNPDCANIQSMHKPGQRLCRINVATVSQELQRFGTRYYQFASHKELNDMWLEIEFHDEDYERATVAHVQRLLARCYSPFDDVSPAVHC